MCTLLWLCFEDSAPLHEVHHKMGMNGSYICSIVSLRLCVCVLLVCPIKHETCSCDPVAQYREVHTGCTKCTKWIIQFSDAVGPVCVCGGVQCFRRRESAAAVRLGQQGGAFSESLHGLAWLSCSRAADVWSLVSLNTHPAIFTTLLHVTMCIKQYLIARVDVVWKNDHPKLDSEMIFWQLKKLKSSKSNFN